MDEWMTDRCRHAGPREGRGWMKGEGRPARGVSARPIGEAGERSTAGDFPRGAYGGKAIPASRPSASDLRATPPTDSCGFSDALNGSAG